MNKIQKIKNLTDQLIVALTFCGDGKTKKSLKAIVLVSQQYQKKVAEIINEKEYGLYGECSCEFVCPPNDKKCYKVRECNNCKCKKDDTSI